MKKVIITNDKSSIIGSILFLVIGILLFLYSSQMIEFMAYILGVVFAVIGGYRLISYYKSKESINVSSIDLTIGITLVVIGIIIIFCSSVIEFVIRLVMGGWILFSGVNKLIVSLNNSIHDTKWKVLIGISILLILSGLYIILKSNLIISTFGLVVAIYSSIDIISYLLYSKNKDVV